MNFRQFVEAKLGSFVYTLPKDKEKQLYDFYMLSALPRTGDVDIDSAREHTFEILLPALKRNLLDALFFSICAELRHIFSQVLQDWEQITGILDKDVVATLTKYKDAYDETYYPSYEAPIYTRKGPKKGEYKKYTDSWRAVKNSGASDDEIVKAALQAYERLDWEPAFGGKMWADIARGWMNLKRAQNRGDLMVHIDRVYQLQHNNDTVFNKIQKYTKDGKFDWIKKALDHKFRIRSPYEIMNKVSSPMKRLAGFILKANKGTSLEGFEQQREREFNKKFKDHGTRRIALPGQGFYIEEKDLKEFARKAISGNLDEGIADMYIKYGDYLDDGYRFKELIDAIDITPTHEVFWGRAREKIQERASEYAKKNYKVLDDIERNADWRMVDQKIADELGVCKVFARDIIHTFSQLKRWPMQHTPGDKISHTIDSFGDIIVKIPNTMGAFFRGEGTSIGLYPKQVFALKKAAKIGEQEALSTLANYIPELNKRTAKSLLDYIVKIQLSEPRL